MVDDQGGTQHAVAFLEELLMKSGEPAAIPPELSGVQGFDHLYAVLCAVKEALHHFSRGDFTYKLRQRGALAGSLKALQSNIRSLAWQCNNVAAGDLNQKVIFMGELSEAFNNMTKGLADQRETIQQKQGELVRLTEELQQEIQKKNEMEAALRASKEMYHQKSLRDPLTGLYNRGYFFDAATREVENMKRLDGGNCCVLMIDIDHFKRFNDTYGHLCGDRAIKMVANSVNQILRKSDIFARYGGEEFALLLTSTDLENGAAIAERIRVTVAGRPSPVQGSEFPVTVSIGLSCLDSTRLNQYTQSNKVFLEALAAADAALYLAKETGRNQVQVSWDWQR